MVDFTVLGPERPRPISRVEYDRLVEIGFFGDDERLELLRGVIVEMSPQGVIHAEVIRRLPEILLPPLVGRARVQVQLPLALSDDSEPEPDVAVIPAADYSGGHPETAWLVIEVADSSLAKDRDLKADLYAAAGIPEYWVVDIPNRRVHVFTGPRPTGYASRRLVSHSGSLTPTRFPDLEITVADIIP